jgi:hypothetical protein
MAFNLIASLVTEGATMATVKYLKQECWRQLLRVEYQVVSQGRLYRLVISIESLQSLLQHIPSA